MFTTTDIHHSSYSCTCFCYQLPWLRGKCEEAMREVLGAGRGVQAGEVETRRRWQQRRDERRGGERRAMRRATDAMRHRTARAYGYATHIKPQGFTSRPPLLTTNKVFSLSASSDGNVGRRWLGSCSRERRPDAFAAAVLRRVKQQRVLEVQQHCGALPCDGAIHERSI